MTRYPRGVLVSCEVPWDERERFMDDLFRQEVRGFLAQGFQHIYIFGTAGEGYAVDNGRFKQVAQVFREETLGDGVLPQVGVIALATVTVRERIDIAYELGFRTFQISLPSWGALNDSETMRFFRDVCLAYPEAKFLHYNLLRTKRFLTAADYRKLVDAIPNLVATKNTSPDVTHTAALLRTVPDLQHFFGESTFVNGCAAGECSLLSSFAPLFPRKSLELYRLSVAREFGAALAFQRDYLSGVMEILAPMLRQTYMDGAYDKALVRLGGFPMPLRLLSPYDALPEAVFEECRRVLQEKYADWN